MADYGYTKLAELFESLPHVLQVGSPCVCARFPVLPDEAGREALTGRFPAWVRLFSGVGPGALYYILYYCTPGTMCLCQYGGLVIC